MYRTVPSSPLISPRKSTSPRKQDTSPRPTHQSVLEASISELTFDPDLTFMDSPPAYSSSEESPARIREQAALLNVSLPVFDASMKPVSPDRTIAPIDSSEIGFSNSLKASLERDKSKEPAAKRPRTKRSESPPKTEPLPTVTRSTRKAKQVPSSSEVVVGKKPARPKAEEPERVEEPRSVRKTRPEIIESQTPTRTKRSKVAEKSVEPKQAAVEKVVDTIRKSPRFASKVIAGDDAPQLLSCKVCHKAYKRVKDYERHIASCK